MRKAAIWTVLGLATVVLIGINAQAQDRTYIGAEKCKMCHKQQYASWMETTHAKATEDAKASTDRTYEPSCLSCHATNSDEAISGVQCEMCHGPGSDYKKMSVMKDRDMSIANGLNIPSQETCDKCHSGDDHSKKVVIGDNIDNRAAIHEFKNPPGE
jgi:ribosomal protein L40E